MQVAEPVARIERQRNAGRTGQPASSFPDFADAHPGYKPTQHTHMKKGPAQRGLSVFHVRSRSLRQWIGPQLDVHGARLRALAALHQPGRAITVGAPQPAALPAGIRIVDAAVEALGIEAHRIRDADRYHLPVLEGHEAVAEVRGRDRDVLAEPERVVLVDPGVVARLDAGGLTLEARAGITIECPTLRAVVAGRVRAVERGLALAAIEAHETAVRSRAPDDSVLVDVAAADAVALLRHVEDFRQFRLRIVTQKARRAAEHAD